MILIIFVQRLLKMWQSLFDGDEPGHELLSGGVVLTLPPNLDTALAALAVVVLELAATSL